MPGKGKMFQAKKKFKSIGYFAARVIRLPKPKLISEYKAEIILVALPYC
jgi:hypothetical protein